MEGATSDWETVMQDLINRVEKLEEEHDFSSGRKKNRLRMREVRKAESEKKYGGRIEGGAPLLKTDSRLPYKTWALVADQFANDPKTPPLERVPKYLRFLMRAYLAAYRPVRREKPLSRSNGVLKYTAGGVRVITSEANFFGRTKQRPELLYEVTAFEFLFQHFKTPQHHQLNLQAYHPVVREDFDLLTCRYNYGAVTVRGVEGFCLDNPKHFKPHNRWLVSRASHLLCYFKQGFHNQDLSDEDKRYLAIAERLIEQEKS